jgi:hypothetical protein
MRHFKKNLSVGLLIGGFMIKAWALPESVIMKETLLKDRPKPIDVVEISHFYCPHCANLNKNTARFEKKVKEGGGVFDFVPITLLHSSTVPMQIYLGAPALLSGAIRERLFRLIHQEGLTLNNLLKACTALHDNLADYSLEECLHNAESSSVKNRVQATTDLINQLTLPDTVELPLFVIEQEGKIIKILWRNEEETDELFAERVWRVITSFA